MSVWLVEDDVPRRGPLPSSNLVHFGRWRHARGREHCHGEHGSALSGGYDVAVVLRSVLPSATTRPRVAVPGETNLSTQVTTGTTQ